jgi:hypothetical protein
MLRRLSTLLAAAAFPLVLAGAFRQEAAAPKVDVPIHPNAICPIMGKPISTRLFVDTDRGRFWVCCKACYEDILADLDTAHATAYPDVKVLALERCPVTGEELPEVPHRLVVQGFDVPLCCEPCAAPFLRDSQVHLALLADGTLEDLANPKCPVTGEAVSSQSYVTIDRTLVRLSSPRAVEAVRAEPAKMLTAARGIVAEHGKIPRPKCPKKEAAERESGVEKSAPR